MRFHTHVFPSFISLKTFNNSFLHGRPHATSSLFFGPLSASNRSAHVRNHNSILAIPTLSIHLVRIPSSLRLSTHSSIWLPQVRCQKRAFSAQFLSPASPQVPRKNAIQVAHFDQSLFSWPSYTLKLSFFQFSNHPLLKSDPFTHACTPYPSSASTIYSPHLPQAQLPHIQNTISCIISTLQHAMQAYLEHAALISDRSNQADHVREKLTLGERP